MIRSEEEITVQLEARRLEWHERGRKMTVEQAESAQKQIKSLMLELSACLSDGAKPCPECGTRPHGMKRRENLYEIGCLGCAPRLVGGRRVSFSTQAVSPIKAADLWNAGRYIVDDKLHLIPGYVPPPLTAEDSSTEA